MRLPILNKSSRPLNVFMEPTCDEFQIQVGEKAILRIDDGALNSLDIDDGWLTIWDDSCEATVEIVSKDDMRADDAIMLACIWLHNFGAGYEAQLIERAVDALEPAAGYFKARWQVFAAFHKGLTDEEAQTLIRNEPKDASLAACYRAGVIAARRNQAARKNRSFPDVGAPAPLDTDTVQSAFARALA